MPPGGSYAEAILNAIQNASSFVLIYSERSNVSPHVLQEVERALNFRVNIILVRFDRSVPSKSLDTNMTPMGFKVRKVNDYDYLVSLSFIYSWQGGKTRSSGIRDMKLELKPAGRAYEIAAISKSDLR